MIFLTLLPQAQLVLLASQITWSEACDGALAKLAEGAPINVMEEVLGAVEETLNILADSVLHDQVCVTIYGHVCDHIWTW